jgi:hypothetical protein
MTGLMVLAAAGIFRMDAPLGRLRWLDRLAIGGAEPPSRRCQAYKSAQGAHGGPERVAGKRCLDAGSVDGRELLGHASKRRLVDVGGRVQELDCDWKVAPVNVDPDEGVDYLDGVGNVCVPKRDARGVCSSVVPTDHDVRPPLPVSIGDGDDDVRFCSGDSNFETAGCIGGAEPAFFGEDNSVQLGDDG